MFTTENSKPRLAIIPRISATLKCRQKIENFTRHLRLSSDCGPYWHNTGQTLQQPCVKTV